MTASPELLKDAREHAREKGYRPEYLEVTTRLMAEFAAMKIREAAEIARRCFDDAEFEGIPDETILACYGLDREEKP